MGIHELYGVQYNNIVLQGLIKMWCLVSPQAYFSCNSLLFYPKPPIRTLTWIKYDVTVQRLYLKINVIVFIETCLLRTQNRKKFYYYNKPIIYLRKIAIKYIHYKI